MERCSLFSPEEIETFKKTREIYLNDVANIQGFAEAFSTFGRLTWLESSITKLICTSRVPTRETRKLLRCRNPDQASNVPVFQFMRSLFNQIGFEISIIDIGPRHVTFRIQPPIYESPTKQRKTCYTTAEAICRFFSKDLSLKCNVEEVDCVNEGAESCTFKCALEFIELCRVALDEQDKRLIKLISENLSVEELLEKGYDKDRDALDYRFDVLKEYDIIDNEHKLTENGKLFLDYLIKNPEEEKDFETPWEHVKNISSKVSIASSFAEALKETTDEKNLRDKNE
jgi:predicted hydrocarbon binding protein